MHDFTKRAMREEKRVIKRAGGKRRRRRWKQALAEDPEAAPHAPADFGRYGSAALNGLDRDPTRRRPTTPPAPEPGVEPGPGRDNWS